MAIRVRLDTWLWSRKVTRPGSRYLKKAATYADGSHLIRYYRPKIPVGIAQDGSR